MLEQLGEPEKSPRVSRSMSLGILAAYLLGVAGAFFLFIFLQDRPFGIQIATVIVYTYFAFWYVFFPTRGLEAKYSLRDKSVQQQLPRLLVIHSASLIFIFLGQTVLRAMKLRLPSYWLTRRGNQGDTLYQLTLLFSPFIVFWTQVLISRRILGRSVKKNLNKSEPEWIGMQDKS